MQNTPKRNSFYIPEGKYSINTTAANPRAVEQEAAVLLANRARDSFYGLVPLDTTAEEDTRSYALTLAKGVASTAAKMLALDPYRQAKTLWRLADDRMAKGKAFWDEIRQAPQGLDAQEMADYLSKRLPDLDARYEAARERSLKSVQLTRQKQERFLQTMHLTQDEKDNPYVYMFGAGAGSLAAGVLGGIYFKAPKAVSVLFGLNQAQNTWEEATENGVPRAKAALTATLAGSAEALLECVGLGRLEKAFEASKGVKRILGSALTEFLQEGSQQSAEETIMQTMGGRVQSGLDTFKSIALSAAMGAVLGGGAGGLHAAFARGVKRFEKLGAPKETAQALAAKAVEAGTSKEMTEEAVRLAEDQENPVNWPDNDIIKGQEEFRKAAQKQDFAKVYDDIENRAKEKFKTAGLTDEEAALGAAVETNIVKMQAAHLGLTPELAEKSLDISFNQELSENDAKIRFISEMQTMSAEEQEAFYKNSKMTSYQEMLGELNAYRAGLSENGARTFAQAAAMYKSPHKEFAKFYEAAQNNAGKKQSYYTHTTKNGLEVDIPSDTILHDKKHPEMTAEMWEQALGQMDSAKDFFVTKPQYGVGADILLNLNGEFGAEITVLPTGRIILNTAFKSTDKGINAWIQKEKNARTPYPFVFGSRPHDLQKSPGKFPSRSSLEGSHTPDNKPVFMGNPNINSLADIVQEIKGTEFNQGARGRTFYQQENIHALDDFDDNAPANAFVKSRAGHIAHGIIGPELSAAAGIEPGEIRVYNSLKSKLTQKKVEETHSRLEQIKILGYDNPIDFIDDVMKNLALIQKGNDNSLLFTGNIGKNNTVAVRLERERGYYKVTTIMPRRKISNKKTVWEAALPLRDKTRTTGEIGLQNNPIGPNGTISIAPKEEFFKPKSETFYQFAGPNAQTADPLALNRAEQLLADGQDPEAVRRATGWFKGVDGKWRFEISDKDAQILPPERSPALEYHLLRAQDGLTQRQQKRLSALDKELNRLYLTLDEILQHEKLYAAYPALRQVEVLPRMTAELDGADALLTEDGQIQIDRSLLSKPEKLKPVLMHEVQHWIQQEEDFARGGSPADFGLNAERREELEEEREALLQEQEETGADNSDRLQEIELELDEDGSGGYDEYRRLAGEVEARNTEARINLTEEERRAAAPESTQDVENADAVILFDDGSEFAYARKETAHIKPELRYQGARGKTAITSKDGFIRAVITAGQAADKSTFVHEMAHVYLSAFQHVYGMEEYAAQRKHLDAWLGQPRGGVYSRAQQEKFAQGFEQFLKEGKAPAPYLKSVFEKFRAWIIRVYNGADISKLSAAAREAYADMLASERNDAQKTVEFYQSAKKDFGRIRATLEKIKQDKLDIKDLDGVDLAALRDFIGILKKPAPALPKRTLLTDLRRYGAQYANSGRIDKEAYKNARVYNKATGVGDKPAAWLVKHGYMEDADVQTYEEASARDAEACELIERALAGEPVYKLEDRERVELHDAYREAVNMAEDAIGADYKNYEKLLESLDALKKQGYRAVEKSDLDFIQEKFEELANLRESEAFLAQEESFGRVDDAKRGSADERRKDKTQKAKLENLRKAQAVKKAVLDELQRRNLFVEDGQTTPKGKLQNMLPADAKPIARIDTKKYDFSGTIKEVKNKLVEWYKNNLQGTYAVNPELGRVDFTRAGIAEIKGKALTSKRAYLVTGARNVIEQGKVVGSNEVENHPGGIRRFHFVQGQVDIDGKPVVMQVDVAEDGFGKKFYYISEIQQKTLEVLPVTKNTGSSSDTDSITKNNEIFKAPAKNKLAAVREELNKAKTVEEIYKAADRALLVMEEAYGNTEAGKAEAGRMAPPAQDWDARRVELLKDLADINQKTDANAAWAFAAIERGGLITPHKSGIPPQEWNAPAAVSDKQRKMNVWKAEQILDEQLRNRYYKAFEKALGKIEGLKTAQKSMLLREFNNVRYRNKNAPEMIVKTLKSAQDFVEKNYKNHLAGKIEEIVKTPLFEKSGSLRTAKYSPAAQEFLKAAHRIVTLDNQTARDSYARAVENQNYDEALSKTQILQNRLLQLKAAPETMTPAEVKDVYDQMREIQKAGRDEVRLEKYLRNTREDIWRERLIGALEKQKITKGAVLYIKKLANWQSILNTLFGEIEADAEVNGRMGKEKIKFMDALSLEQNQIQMQNHVRSLRRQVVERVGEAYGLKNGNDYIKKINELQSETYTLQNYGEIPEGPAELLTERQKKPFLQTITKLELLFFYIQDKNPLNRARLMRAYRQEQYETLFAPITAQDKKAAAALMQIAQSTYGQMNEVHKRERGFTLGRVENYFPNRTERLTGGLDYLREMLANNAAPSAIKARVQTVSAVEKPVNPVSLLMSEISRNAEYIYGAESAGKLRRIFRDTQMARALEEKFGKKDGRDIYEHIIKMIDLNGPGARIAAKSQFFEKMEFLFNNWVKSAIGLKPIVAIKQFASAFNYAENMPVAAWTSGFKDALLHPRETLRFMRELSPYLVTRYEEGGMNETLGRALAQDETFGTADKINTLTNAITVNVRLGDMFALAFGGKPYVDWLINEKGYSRERAREAFELATVRAQQANLKSTLNEAQMSGGNLFWRAAWAFRNQQMQYARKLYDAYVDYKNGYIGEKDMAKKVFMYAAVQPALYTLLSLGWFAADDDDRKDDWWRLAASPVEQTLGAVPFGDDAAELLFNNLRSLCEDGKLTGLRAYELPGVADMYRTFNKLASNFNSGDADLGDWLDAAAEMGQFSGFGTKQLKTQISGLYDAVTGKPAKGAMKVVGYTQNRANKVTGDDDE